ncbi:apolipoprotein N-acyltransferase [Roseibacillus persicicus]|uniref:apolipoprotein N-acyltransferase n=1 Tax=Roseibacillus persicicus TaxID=454148 RepID=UPI00398AEB07
MRKILTVMWPFLLALFGGGLLAFCFAPFNWADLVWLAPVLWMAAFWLGTGKRRPRRKGFFLGWLAGLAFWSINLKWLATVTGGAYLILAAYLALYFAFFGLFASSAGNPFHKERPDGTRMAEALRSLGFAALNAGFWCGLEWIRGWMLTGFGWNGLGVAFHDRLPLAQGAELVGVTGLAFLPVFLAGVMVQVGVRLGKGVQAGKMQRHWDFAVAILLLVVCFTYGVFRTVFINRSAGDTLRVLLVQMDIPQSAGHVEWSGEEVHEGYESETLRALSEVDARNGKRIAEAEGEVELESVDWVVWPEVVLYGILLNGGGDEFALYEPSSSTLQRMREAGVRNLMAGIWEVEAERVEGGLRPTQENGSQYNALLSVNPAGELATHRKQHLVIYGEFIPFVDSVKWLGDIYEKVAGVPWGGNLGRGVGSEGLTLPGANGEVNIIPSICFEDTVPRVTRKFSKGEREVIVNITNDGWFGTSEGSQQHFDNALFRAIELRRPMLRAANRGVTGAVSATGSLVDYETGKKQVMLDEEGKPFVRGSILTKVKIPERGGPTLYARAGDWFSVLGLVVALGWMFRCLGCCRGKGKIS